ncbi:YbjN domain-containing protein [Leptolyngbya sp. FACHB-261]|uniref:YbjN domain-containing protein n=1 Tax=Leptolyngbya sp. FACHB-261 TaxID=2692806 RepID=UPI0016897C37|nr:YbjN domain-containing protein [Leptolyngbya sp. FACHB-261]MBD2102426.1 YbjN domain-containing protein [Leptolyngbya sp. FACHB-261]
MEFETEAQRACYDKVATWMGQLFGKFPCARPDVPGLGLFRGSALVEVLIYPWGENDAVINSRSFVAVGAELTSDLMLFLLQENARMRFGAFGVDQKGDILFEDTIVDYGDDKKEFEASVTAVLDVADEYDDLIVSKWGGQRALDRIREFN